MLYTFQFGKLFSMNKGYVRSYHNGLFRNRRRQETFMINLYNNTAHMSYHGYLAMMLLRSSQAFHVSCLAMILTRYSQAFHVSCLAMILTRVPWLTMT